MKNVHKVTDETFTTDVIQAAGLTLVDFWAEWCGPCKSIGPLLEDLAIDKQGQVKVMQLNVDDSPHTPTEYGVRGIPTLMLFKDGQLAATKVGSVSKSQLYQWVEALL